MRPLRSGKNTIIIDAKLHRSQIERGALDCRFMRSAWAKVASTSSGNSQQNGIAVKFEKLPLAFGEGPDIDHSLRFNTHPLQGRFVGDRRDDEVAGILKPDKSTVEQMIDAGRQQ